MDLYTEAEIAFLQQHRIGRLATAGASGRPHVVPTGFHVDAGTGSIKIGAHDLEERGQERLYRRHLAVNPRAAFVVDDLITEPTWQPRGISLKGEAVLHTEGGEVLGPGFGPEWVEIVVDWVSSWGIDTQSHEPAVPRTA